MSKQIKDGGPAFPMCFDDAPSQDGMSLRDFFAAKAMQGAAASAFVYSSHAQAARDAYEMADSMIAAREAKS